MSGRSRRPARRPTPPPPSPPGSGPCAPAGARRRRRRVAGVCGVIASSPSARTHGQGVADLDPARRRLPCRRHDVRPRLVHPSRRVVDPERAEPEVARLAVEQGAEDAGRVEARDAEPVDRAVGRDQGTGVAVGQERIVRDRRERGGCGRALLGGLPRSVGAHDATQGSCQPPYSRGQLVRRRRPPRPGRVAVDRWRCVEQRLHDPPRLLDPVLSGEPGALSRPSRRGAAPRTASAPRRLRRRTPCRDRSRWGRRVRPQGLHLEPDAGRRIQLDDELIGLWSAIGPEVEAEPGRVLEHQPELGLGYRQLLAGPDEERHPRPAPVVDVEPQRGVGLGGRIRGDAVDVPVPLVLAADIVGRIGLGDGTEQSDLRVLDRLRIPSRRGLHRGRGHDLHQVIDHHVAQRTDGIIEVAPVLDAEVLGHRDLHAFHEVPVPDRLEHRVGEPQVEDLLEPHLSQVVVDPVQLRLVEELVQFLGQGAGGGSVAPERLLHHDAPRRGQAGSGQALDHRAEQERRDLKVEHRAAGALIASATR